jgi:peroxiredoxin-like protein
METHEYNVEVTWNTGRKGTMCSPELLAHNTENTCIEVATPPEFPQGVAGIWTPEHLFTAAVSSCLMTTFLAVAENSKLNFKDFSCKSTGKLEKVENKFMITEVRLEPTLTISHEQDRERAERILHKSEAACLISNSVKSTISMFPTIIVAP